MKIVEEERQRFPDQVAEMLITIENMPARSLSVQRLAEETFEDALNNTTKASESPLSPQYSKEESPTGLKELNFEVRP